MSTGKWALALLLGCAVVAFFALDLDEHLTLASVQASREWILGLYQSSPLTVTAGYFGLYVLMAGLSVPGATVMTLLGGAVFGVMLGTLVVSFASTLGATLAFVMARYLLRDMVQARFARVLEPVNRGMDREGGFYLFAIRLVPAFPFFAVNLVMGLTSLRPWTFAWVSQLGMLPGTIVYVNAGVQLGQLKSLGGILTPGFILSFVALGLLPLISRRVLDALRRARLQRDFERPARFDRNVIVIGAGSAGLVSALIAAAVRAKVTLIERHKMGGDCLNTGCVPSKTLIRTARLAADMRRAERFGIRATPAQVDFPAVMARVREVIAAIEPHDSVERYTGLGVECLAGEARIVSPWAVEVDGRTLTTRSIIIAAGARPFVPPIEGVETVEYFTSDTIWSLDALPQRLVVLGGGPIGCELAQCFARFGADVSIVEMADRLLLREDEGAGDRVAQSLEADGVHLYLGHSAASVKPGSGRAGSLLCRCGDEQRTLAFDALLLAVGRKPNVEGYGLEALNIGTGQGGVVQTDEYLQTLHPNIFACGDVAGPYQFTHAAGHQAWYAAVNALFGQFKRFAVDYSAIPRVTYTDPEVAAVGLTPAQATERGVDFEVTCYGIDDLDRAIVDGEAHGEVKVLTATGSDRILGASIVGAHAGDLIAEWTLAMRHGLGLKKILGTVHAYPTMMEANKYAAGVWRRAHTPGRLLGWVARYHAWRRG